jgi:hypothetical protein
MTHDVLNDAEWPGLFERCRAVLDLEESAWEYGAFRQARGVPSVEALLRLALGYGPGGLSLRQAAAWAAVGEVAELSRTALMNRLRNAADWLGALAGALAAGRAAVTGSLGERPLCLVDGSVLTAPGSCGADWRLHVAYDPVGQRLLALELTDASGAELLERAPVTVGEIRIGDRVFGNRPEGVRKITDGPGDFLVRVGWRALHWLDRTGQPFDVLAFLKALGAAPIGEAEVCIGRARKKKGFRPVPARLIAVKLPPEAVEKAQGRAQRASRKGGNKIQPGTLAAAGYMLLLTSLDATDYPAERVASLYRLRWQVELAVKRLKSLLHIDRLPAKGADLARAWLYAHLIAALLIDDLAQDLLLDSPPCGPGKPVRDGETAGQTLAALALAPGAELGPRRPRRRSRTLVPPLPHRRHAAPAPPLL